MLASVATSSEDLLRTLETVLRPVVHLAIEQKLPYPQMEALLKGLYFDESWQVARSRRLVPNRTILGGLSGLSLNDIKQLWARGDEDFQAQTKVRNQEIASELTPAAMVVAEWLARGWPLQIPMRGREQSLSKLRTLIAARDKRVRDVSLRLLFDDLHRSGVIQRNGANIVLVNPVGVSKSSGLDRGTLVHVAGAAGDHLRAITSNLTRAAQADRQTAEKNDKNGKKPEAQERFLEQSVSVDGLTEEGARRLHAMARTWWTRMAARFSKHSLHELEAKTTGGDARHRIRLGTYFYAEQTPQALPSMGLEQK